MPTFINKQGLGILSLGVYFRIERKSASVYIKISTCLFLGRDAQKARAAFQRTPPLAPRQAVVGARFSRRLVWRLYFYTPAVSSQFIQLALFSPAACLFTGGV
jgi:hypothetical protein